MAYTLPAERALQAAEVALQTAPQDTSLARALGDAHRNLAAARFADRANQLGLDESLPTDLLPSLRDCCQVRYCPIEVSAAWAKRVERAQRPYWEELAARHDRPLADYLARVDTRMRRVVAGCHLYVRVPYEVLPEIMAAGRLGTSTWTGQWGAGRLSVRQQTERAIWDDCPRHLPEEMRHVYGILARPEQWRRIVGAPPRRRHFGLDRFGDVDLELSSSALVRSTVTFGALADVTDCGHRPGCCPRPFFGVNHAAYPVHVADRGFGWHGWATVYRTSDPLTPGNLSPLRHVLQAHVRGPVTLEEIVSARPAFPVDDDTPLPLIDEFNTELQRAA